MTAGINKYTPTKLLPKLSHIPSPNLRRINALTRKYKDVVNNQKDINKDSNHNCPRCRKPPIRQHVLPKSLMDLPRKNLDNFVQNKDPA